MLTLVVSAQKQCNMGSSPVQGATAMWSIQAACLLHISSDETQAARSPLNCTINASSCKATHSLRYTSYDLTVNVHLSSHMPSFTVDINLSAHIHDTSNDLTINIKQLQALHISPHIPVLTAIKQVLITMEWFKPRHRNIHYFWGFAS